MMYPKPLVNVFKDIAQAVSDSILTDIQAAELVIRQETQAGATESNIIGINYQFGHLKEIIATMKEWEGSPNYRYQKYPLIALMLDFPEQMGVKGGNLGDVTLQIVIAYATDPNYKAAERYERNFKPILLPIYYELLEQINANGAFTVQSAKTIQHTKYDRPYWGVGGLSDTHGNVFNDYIDAIEIANMKLTRDFSNCKTT